jgi:hypothetical protein
MDALRTLYPKLSVGGLVYVDDYFSFTGCQRAVDEYLATQQTEAGKSPTLHFQFAPEDLSGKYFSPEILRRKELEERRSAAVWWRKG